MALVCLHSPGDSPDKLELLTRNLQVHFIRERRPIVVAGKALVFPLIVLRPPPAVDVDHQRP